MVPKGSKAQQKSSDSAGAGEVPNLRRIADNSDVPVRNSRFPQNGSVVVCSPNHRAHPLAPKHTQIGIIQRIN